MADVECNLDWLERDWPLPALEADAAVPAESSAVLPTRDNEAAAESARAIAAGNEADETKQQGTPSTELPRVDSVPPSEPSSAPDAEDQGRAAVAALRESVKRRPQRQAIVRVLPELYGDNVAATLDGFTATEPFQAAALRYDLVRLAQNKARPGTQIRDRDVASEDTCGRLLKLWQKIRAEQRASNC